MNEVKALLYANLGATMYVYSKTPLETYDWLAFAGGVACGIVALRHCYLWWKHND